MKRYTIKKIKDGIDIEVILFDKNKILNEVDKILSSYKMYDKYVSEISYKGMRWEYEYIYEGARNTHKGIDFYTPMIGIDCTSEEAKSAVIRLMRKEGFKTGLYSSLGVVVYKWDEDKIFQLTRKKEKK